MSSRTPEQTAADDNLTRAIEQVLAAYYDPIEDAPASVLTEYVVIAAQSAWDSDGDGITAISTIHRDSDVPIHRCLGLMEYAATRYRNRISQHDET